MINIVFVHCLPYLVKQFWWRLQVMIFWFPDYYMDNVYAVGSDKSFPSTLPGPLTGPDYQLCGQYPGTPPVGQTSVIICWPQPVTARYFYIQVDRLSDPRIIELCEVWIYASKFPFTSYITVRWKAIMKTYYLWLVCTDYLRLVQSHGKYLSAFERWYSTTWWQLLSKGEGLEPLVYNLLKWFTTSAALIVGMITYLAWTWL